jgi:hypothetical protein
MIDWPKIGELPNTFHDLTRGGRVVMWYWNGRVWSTKPTNDYTIKTSQIKELGWQYIGIVKKL